MSLLFKFSVILGVVMPSIIMLNVLKLSDIKLSAMATKKISLEFQ
jgi:hypothetical protein